MISRISNYNYHIKHGQRVVYFNAISNQIFSVAEKEHSFLQDRFKDLIEFEILYPSIFNKFKEWGFICNNDELDLFRLRNREEIFMNRNYILLLYPTLDCNFNCWYCYQKHEKGYMSDDIMERVRKHLCYMVEHKEISGLNLSWFGGEPLLYFDEVVFPLSIYAKELMEKNRLPFTNSITTNGSLLDAEMVARCQQIGLKNFQITIDGDEKRHNKIRNINGVPTFNTILENINLLCHDIEAVNITLRLNYDDQTLKVSDMERVFQSIPEAYRQCIKPIFQRVWQTNSKSRLSKEKDSKSEHRLNDLCRELGYSCNPITMFGKVHKCYADRYYEAIIHYDGKVHKCTARDHNVTKPLGELKENGEIVWDKKVISRRLSKATFENEECLKCKYMPICLGPCSQKMEERNGPNEIDCIKDQNDINFHTSIIKYYEMNSKLAKMKIENNISQ